MASTAFYGTLVHSVNETECLKLMTDTYCLVNGDGVITELETNLSREKAAERATAAGATLTVLTYSQFIMPGFIDTHIHAPQYLNIGLGYHLELLDWLDKYTFPLEKRFADADFASKVYDKVVRRTLKNGTTTACYYGTIHCDSTLILAQKMHVYGQRGYVGKVNMDTSPSDYCESLDESLSSTRRFINTMREKYGGEGLLTACITPRFALSCSTELMSKLADLAKEFDLPVQTHMSENKSEVAEVKKQYQVSEYVQVYEQAGLLTERTILGHCVHSGDDELNIIRKYRSGIAHCPNSNTSLNSGDMNVRQAMKLGVKVGLGTDVSGGYGVSIRDATCKAVEVSKHVAMHKTDLSMTPIEYREAFYLATLGGATVMGLEDKIGNFEIGKQWDALLIDTMSDGSPFDIFDINEVTDKKELVQKFLYCGDDRNISQVFVKGRKIHV